MRRVIVFLFVTAVFGSSAFAQRIPIKNVAVIETEIDERSGAASDINKAEVSVITNEIRRAAVNNLPRGRFNVMTTETVQSMGAAVLEECAEENCVIALGSKIGADYIVRGIISKFAGDLTITVEMYETDYGMLVATADPVHTVNLRELLEKTTAVCAAMYKKFLEAAPQPAVKTSVPAAYTLAVSAAPFVGGTVTRAPNQPDYASKTPVTVTAAPADGYRFTGWSGSLTSANSKETVVMDSNITLTANFVRTYMVTTNVMPVRGGSVSRDPDRIRYDAGTQITLTAAPAAGYRFTGWKEASGALMPKDSLLTRTINSNLSLTASFSKQRERPERPPTAEPSPQTRTLDDAMADGRKRVEPKPKPEEPKKSSPLKLTMRISTAALAAGGFIGGAVYGGKAKSEHEKYEDANGLQEIRDTRKNAEDFKNAGNLFYTLGWIGLSGFTLTLFF